MNFGEIIKEILKSTGMTELQLAGKSGSTQPTINRIKHGGIVTPGYCVGKKLIEIHTEIRREKA